MSLHRVLSADSHVVEPADVWTSRIDARYRDRAPHVVKEANGIKGDFFLLLLLRSFKERSLYASISRGNYPSARWHAHVE
jgi:hypothetical protein